MIKQFVKRLGKSSDLKKSRLPPTQVVEIIKLVECSFPIKDIAKFYEVNPATIYRIIWSHEVKRMTVEEFVEFLRSSTPEDE